MATQWVSRRQDRIIPLSTAEQENNVTCLWERLSPLGFTVEAVAAIAGNMQYEGLLNPAQYEDGYNYSLSGGGGLCGWTPIYDASDTYYRHLKNWCDSQGLNFEDGDAQCAYIYYELTDWNNAERFMANSDATLIGLPANPPITARQFITSTLSADTLADYWLCYYERPLGQYLVSTEPYRSSAALSWYNFLQNIPPTPPTPTTRRKMPIWMMCRKNRTIRRF